MTTINETALNTGNKIPLVGFGTWELSGQSCEKYVLEALDIGYRLFDTAKMYGNEKQVGNAIRRSSINRADIYLITKLNASNNSYLSAKHGIEESLNELQTDYLDMLLIHEPYSNSLDMYKAMKEALEKGKIKALGISNFNERLYKEFISKCDIVPAVNQVEAHIFYQKQNLQNLMQDNGTVMMAWSPLGAGLKDVFNNEIIRTLSKKYSKTPAQIALKFLVDRNICIIPRTSHKENMIDKINLFDFELSPEDINALTKLDKNTTLFPWTKYCDTVKLNY